MSDDKFEGWAILEIMGHRIKEIFDSKSNNVEIMKINGLTVLANQFLPSWQKERMILEIKQLKEAFMFPDEIFKFAIEPHLKEKKK